MFEYRETNALRVPDWRWQAATWLLDNDVTRSGPDARSLNALKKYAARLRAANTPSSLEEIYRSDMDMFEAYQLYKSAGQNQNARWEVEARLLAGQTAQEITTKLDYTPRVIDLYAKNFFDVSSRLDKPGSITHAVIKPSAAKGISEREPDVLWKMFGYWCGTVFLDLLIYRFNSPMKPTTPQEIAAFIKDDIREQLQLKTLIAIRSMPINWQTQTEVLNLYLRLVELEKDVGDGADGQEAMKQGIQSLLESLPWTRSAAKAKQHGLIDPLETNGISLRAHELLQSASGDLSPAEIDVIKSAKYPPRLHVTTVSS